ncbi:extracellular solute-binding protein [Halodesulfurarchaeum sp.]|uniref:extracellular solute-binding protein n=1 Tax=Halodesulfurarchaeum sp. TaxID=1980530 RepID=UPI002FC296ED
MTNPDGTPLRSGRVTNKTTAPLNSTRRGFLSLMGTGALGAVAGCLGGETDVSVLSAGSLASVLNSTVGPGFEADHEYGYRGEFHGSNAVMRMVLEEQKQPDVIVSADASLLRSRLPDSIAPWDVVFGSNALVIAYGPDTPIGERLEAGEPWYEVLRSADAEVARSDPDLDPLGYRAVQLFELAADYYGVDGLAADLAANLVIDPKEPHLLANIETGNRAAAIVYKNMAVDHELPYVELPDQLDFSNPEYTDYYAHATYTTEDGTTIEGTPVLYNSTVPSTAPDPEGGRAFVKYLLENPAMLSENGLVVNERFPHPHGPVPDEVLP